jgi:hypothetical protein
LLSLTPHLQHEPTAPTNARPSLITCGCRERDTSRPEVAGIQDRVTAANPTPRAWDTATARIRHGLARQLYNEAELLVGSLGDGELAARVYLMLAMQSTHLARTTSSTGRAREALRFTARAADTARHEPSPRLHALIAMRKATAHAQLGDEVAFRSAIGLARRELDRGAHPADPAWCGFVDHPEVTGHEGMGRSLLGTPARAAALYSDVLTDRGLPRRNRAYYQARLAGALLDDGDRIEAIRQGLRVLPELGERVTSTRTLIELRPARAAAEQVGAEEFVARFDAAARSLPAA